MSKQVFQCAHWILCCAGLLIVAAPPLSRADDTKASLSAAPSNTKIATALDATADWDFNEVPLSSVVAAIQKVMNVDVVIDQRALDDAGIDSDTPITTTVAGISTRSVLQLILDPLELTYVTREGALWITTKDQAEAMLLTGVYPVGDLTSFADVDGTTSYDPDTLISAITSSIDPSAWDEVGGAGSIEAFYGSLVISNTNVIHEQVAALLASYRSLIAAAKEKQATSNPVFSGVRKYAELQRALDRPVTASFTEMPLDEVLNAMAKQIKTPIVINRKALDDFGLDTSAVVTVNFKDVPARFALRRALYNAELTFTLRDEVVMITTPEEAESHLLLGLYPVRDLVSNGSDDPRTFDFDSLIETITLTIAPDSWDEVGGPGAIEELLPEPVLVIPQTLDNHEAITELLTKLRAAKQLEARRVQAAQGEFDDKLVLKAYTIVNDMPANDIVKLITELTGNKVWEETNGSLLRAMGPAVVVRHNSKVQGQVQRILLDLDAWINYAAPQPQPLNAPPGGYF